MWKYVSRRVKDTIDLGITVRKSFTVQNALNHHPQQQQNPSERKQNHNNFYNVVPRHQDPSSRDKERQRDEKFKKKYYRLHQDKKCFLNALTWSAALITGFYASQLVCLYRRNQRLGFDAGRCYYSKYVLQTSHAFHRNAQRFLLTPEGQRQSIVPKVSSFGCPFKKSKREAVIPQSQSQLQSLVDDEYRDLLASDPGYKQYERFFESPRSYPSDGVFNVNHKPTAEATKSAPAQEPESERELSAEEKQDEAIDSAIRELAKIVGELEYQLGVDSMLLGNIEDAIDHFIMSTNQNHPGGIFNLALCYEQGLGVKKNMKTARKLYEMASELGHAKASYNLGVFHAQGLGGFQKNRLEAKQKFEQAAALGNSDAIEALRLLLPVPKKLPVIDEFPHEEFYFNDKMMIPTTVSAISNNLRRIAAI